MIHYNILQNPTEVNLDVSTLASPIGEEYDMPSQSYHLIPEYAKLRISGLSRRKIIQEKYKKVNVIPKVFGFIYLFESGAMYSIKYILTETASFSAKLLHHEERSK